MKMGPSIFTLCLCNVLLYEQFFWNPVVFDDVYFFDGSVHEQYLNKVFSFDLRWLPYATFEWTHALLGLDLLWYRLGNLFFHITVTLALFAFLHRLFSLVIPYRSRINVNLSTNGLAFFAALLFSVHPAAVYAVGYLVQRSTLMATLFVLLTWCFFLEGVLKKNYSWLIASAMAYFLAVLSKEHAIMAPAITVTLLVMVDKSSVRERLKFLWPIYVLYFLIAIFVLFQKMNSHILGQAYEPLATSLMSLMGPEFNPNLAYPLSILTQCFLFFKYLVVWLVPSPAWMSVDMPQDFALSLWSWPELLGLAGFIGYPIIAFRLLFKKGVNGLLGFALLCPWLLFATELSTVRIQESFVLYRSYLWMTGAFAAVPFLCQKLNAKQTVITLSFMVLFMLALSWLRLSTFSHPLLLWDDAARLVEHKDKKPIGVDRIYYNRGSELLKIKHYSEAIADFNQAIKINGYHASYAYHNRGVVYIETKQYLLALNDFNYAIKINPNYPKFYFSKAITLEVLKDKVGAKLAYQKACEAGAYVACDKK